MTSEPHPSQVKAGKIAARVRDEVMDMVKPGKKVFSLCTHAEKKIIDYGGRPAFPCNISIDHVAAHYTSPIGDSTVIPESGLVKVDVGVHVDGYIADTAKTVDIDGALEGFVVATDDALQEAIAMFRPGIKLGDVGKEIEEVIKAYGLKPIKNLSGHNLLRYKLHAGKKVPNVKKRKSDEIEAGEYYAIEPYATNGAGSVIESDFVYIFANTKKEGNLQGVTAKLQEHLRKKYGPFPFTQRWIGTKSKDLDVVEEFRKLIEEGTIRGFPVQISKKGRLVSQSEHTVYVSEKGAVVLT